MPTVPLSVIITTALTTLTSLLVTALYRKLVAYITSSGEWRRSADKRINIINESLVCVMRGDLIHKAHRYVDDKGYASIEEKESWHEEWVQYQSICPRNGFIDTLAEQVMALPEHPASEKKDQ